MQTQHDEQVVALTQIGAQQALGLVELPLHYWPFACSKLEVIGLHLTEDRDGVIVSPFAV